MAQQLRNLNQFDYKKLADYELIPKDSVKADSWSKKKLYKLDK